MFKKHSNKIFQNIFEDKRETIKNKDLFLDFFLISRANRYARSLSRLEKICCGDRRGFAHEEKKANVVCIKERLIWQTRRYSYFFSLIQTMKRSTYWLQGCWCRDCSIRLSITSGRGIRASTRGSGGASCRHSGGVSCKKINDYYYKITFL